MVLQQPLFLIVLLDSFVCKVHLLVTLGNLLLIQFHMVLVLLVIIVQKVQVHQFLVQ